MSQVTLSDEDFVDFVDVKEDTAFAVAELFAFKYLKEKCRGKIIFSKGIFDFVVYGTVNEKSIYVEVKYNHLSLSPEQVLFLAERLGSTRFWIISNKKKHLNEFLGYDGKYRRVVKYKVIDTFNTPIGKFYVLEVIDVETLFSLEDEKDYVARVYSTRSREMWKRRKSVSGGDRKLL